MQMDMENDSEEKISLGAVKEFLQEHNGKVKQSDLINHFRSELTNPVTKGRARQELKDILQLITASKQENGEKYILSKKINRPLSMRKELAKSKLEHQLLDYNDVGLPMHNTSLASLLTQRRGSAMIGEPTSPCDGDVPSLASLLTLGRRGSREVTSIGSVGLLRETFTPAVCTESIDEAISALGVTEAEDLEDEIGLHDGLVVQPEEKEWMLASSSGRIETMKQLLNKYPELVKNRDFIMGYTALHWAAKLGRNDIVIYVVVNGVDIHAKSHGGYTALHIAAMSGKDEIIIQLIELGSNIHLRDHSGRKAKDVVKDTVDERVQRKLGRSFVINPNIVLQTGLISPTQRNRKNRRSFSIISDDENSPGTTPELVRRRVKTVGVTAQKSINMVHRKKKRQDSTTKLTANDILHSPMFGRRPQSTIENPNLLKPITFNRRRASTDLLNDDASFPF